VLNHTHAMQKLHKDEGVPLPDCSPPSPSPSHTTSSELSASSPASTASTVTPPVARK
jgi:hypothetical protein